MTKKNEGKINFEKELGIRLLLFIVLIIVITILGYCSYKLFLGKKAIIPYKEVKSTEEYAYIKISKMSEKFAYYSDSKKEMHFVIEEDKSGLWHTYIIAIKDTDYNKYKAIIDYSYDRTKIVPKSIKVYGYAVNISDRLKDLAINNIKAFVSKDNTVEINNINFNKYLTNSYLDTTMKQKDPFDAVICTLLFILVIIIFLLIILIVTTIKFIKKEGLTYGVKRNRKKDLPEILE